MDNYQTDNSTHDLQLYGLWFPQSVPHCVTAVFSETLQFHTNLTIHFTDKSRQSYILLFGTSGSYVTFLYVISVLSPIRL